MTTLLYTQYSHQCSVDNSTYTIMHTKGVSISNVRVFTNTLFNAFIWTSKNTRNKKKQNLKKSGKSNAIKKPLRTIFKFDVIYETRGRVFHWDFQIPRSGLKKRGTAEFFLNWLQCVWIPNETLFRMFDIASQTDY